MKAKEYLKKVVLLLAVFGLLFAGVTSVFGVQGATSVTPGASSRGAFGNTSSASTTVQAGNVTELNVSGAVITTHWAGFYGEITGGITLQNAGGDMFYNWTGINSPITGKVFASNSSSVSWAGISCMDATGQAALETALGISPNDADRINTTYTSTHPDFSVGGEVLSGCNSTNAYIDTGFDSTTFYQILLADSSGTGNPVYTTLINESQTGFDAVAHDFELLVGVNSIETDYFYLELD
jgi:hypothetical protein